MGQQPDNSASSQPAPRYVPPHRNGTLTDTRYSRDQLLDLYNNQKNTEGWGKADMSNLFIGGWQPDLANGASGASWGRNEGNRDTQPGPDICWDKDGSFEPLGLTEMDDEEREVCITPSAMIIQSLCMLNCTLALLIVCQHASQAAYIDQRESAIQWSHRSQDLYLQPS